MYPNGVAIVYWWAATPAELPSRRLMVSRTSDYGTNWSPPVTIFQGTGPFTRIQRDATLNGIPGDHMIVADGNVLYRLRSVDQGATWVNTGPIAHTLAPDKGSPVTVLGFRKLSFAVVNGTFAILATAAISGGGGQTVQDYAVICRSMDAGVTWTQWRGFFASPELSTGISYIDVSGGLAFLFTWGPASGDVFQKPAGGHDLPWDSEWPVPWALSTGGRFFRSGVLVLGGGGEAVRRRVHLTHNVMFDHGYALAGDSGGQSIVIGTSRPAAGGEPGFDIVVRRDFDPEVVLRYTGAADHPPQDHGGRDLVLESGSRIWGVHSGIGSLVIPEGAQVEVARYDGADPSRGMADLRARHIVVLGTLSARGAGYTGGGGGGGVGGATFYFGGVHGGGYELTGSCDPGSGGMARYRGGLPAGVWTGTVTPPPGRGGPGDGPFAGLPSGDFSEPDGAPGGYGAPESNGDTSTDASALMGSGGAGGWGGTPLVSGCTPEGCSGSPQGGGGGGAGGSGGGIIRLTASHSFLLGASGAIVADGDLGGNGVRGGCAGGEGGSPVLSGEGRAGDSGRPGGTGGAGAGGGIVIQFPSASTVVLEPGGVISTLGGGGATANGGTVKLFHGDAPVDTSAITVRAGRVYRALGRWNAGSTSFSVDPATSGPGGTAGWVSLGENTPGRVTLGWDAAAGAIRASVWPSPEGRHRISGWMSAGPQQLRASAATNRIARARFAVYRAGQADMNNVNQIPNIRFRLGCRFAMTSLLEAFNHSLGDPASRPAAAELRPSADPERPSLFRVDLDTPDVPLLALPEEGILRGFEVYSLEPQENGSICLTESSLATYPKAFAPEEGTAPLKVYEPDAEGAGTLSAFLPGAHLTLAKFIPPVGAGEPARLDETPGGLPTHSEGPWGVTLDSSQVSADRIGVASLEFDPGADLATRVRVEPDRQYHVRFHVTSAQQSSLNPMLRLRARTVKFQWTQKLEVGGAQAASAANNALAAQLLPGLGSMNPDKRIPGEPGGWYNLIMHTPLSAEVRADATGSLAERMPVLWAQPGPGVDAPSLRDLRVGFDLIDTISNGPDRAREQGHFTLDRIEVRSFPLIAE